MKKTWFLIVGVVMGSPLLSGAEPIKMDAPPKVEESTSDADKAAASAAAADADKWAVTAKKEAAAPAAKPGSKRREGRKLQPLRQFLQPLRHPHLLSLPGLRRLSMRAAPTPDTAPSSPPPSVAAAPHRTDLNEMKGKLQSKSDDPRALRMLIDGGYNVEFTYDSKIHSSPLAATR